MQLLIISQSKFTILFCKNIPGQKEKKWNKQTNKQMTLVAHLVASQKMLEHVSHVKWNVVNVKLQAIALYMYMSCDRTSISLMKKTHFKFWTWYMWNLTTCVCLFKFIQGISHWWGHCSSPIWMGCQQISCWKIPSSSCCYVVTKKASRNSWGGKTTELYYQHGYSPHCSPYISLVLIGRICLTLKNFASNSLGQNNPKSKY